MATGRKPVKRRSFIGVWARLAGVITLVGVLLTLAAGMIGQRIEKQLIAYVLASDAERNLYIMDILHGLDYVAVDQPVNQYAWSPDGLQLAFSTPSLNTYVIYILDWQSGDLHQLAEMSMSSVLAWSPDGLQLAFFSTDSLYVGDLQTGTIKEFVSSVNPAPYSDISWSPDGNLIAYNSDRTIEIIHADDGKHLSTIQVGNGISSNPVFSPDGEHIAFGVTERFTSSIYMMDRNAQNQRRLSTDNIAFGPVWSPDSRQIAYLSLSPRTESYLGIIDVKEGTDYPITFLSGSTFPPAWSPDGKFIIFTTNSNEHPNFQIYMISADGRYRRRLTFNRNGESALFPGWQP
jgi:Tol biopolymer transport system component